MRGPKRQPRPPRDMSDASATDLIDPKWLTPYHFDEKPAIVKIEKVMQEELWNWNTNKWEWVTILFFHSLEKGLKVPPSHTKRLQTRFGDSTSGWIGKNVRLVHIEEESFGKKHYLTRIDEHDVPQQQQEIPKAASKEQLEEIEGYGLQLYGDEWESKRPELAQAISKRTDDVEKLYESEAQKMIRGILKRINSQPSEMPENGNEESEEEETQEETQQDQIPEGQEVQF